MFQVAPAVGEGDLWDAIDPEELGRISSEADIPEWWHDVPDDELDGEDESWSALQDEIIAQRRADARLYAALLAAKRAAEHALVDRFGPSVLKADSGAANSFAVEAALALDVSERTAAHLITVADTASRHLPLTWAAFRAGRTNWRAVQTIVLQMAGLDVGLWTEYDAAAMQAIERTPGPRLKQQMHEVRERVQASTAAERRRTAEQQRRVELEPCGDGLAALTLVGPAAELLAIDEALTRVAVAAHGEADEHRGVGALRLDTALDLLLTGFPIAPASADATSAPTRVPQRAPIVPTVMVTVPVLSLLGHGDAPVDLNGYGPIDLETAKRLVATAPSLTRILTDPHTGVRLAMDRTRYRVPRALRRWLEARDATCRFPGCRRSAEQCDLDHVMEWQEGGSTDECNLVALCRRHHRMKSTGLWRLSRDADTGRVVVGSPFGHEWTSDPPPPSAPAPPGLVHPNPDNTDASPPPF